MSQVWESQVIRADGLTQNSSQAIIKALVKAAVAQNGPPAKKR
jgi:hypothetical protein